MHLRILYAAGPGDILGTYEHWKQGRDDPSELPRAYSGQFYEVCSELDARAYAIATCQRAGSLREGRFRIEHRPPFFGHRGGVLYHAGQIWHGLRLVSAAIGFGANVAVVGAYDHWFVLLLLPLLGIRVVPALHCVLYRKYGADEEGVTSGILRRLNAMFFKRAPWAIMSASNDIDRQVARLTKSKHAPVLSFLPTYQRGMSADIPPPREVRSPFRVLFAGRVEPNKGVFDLLEVARRLRHQGKHDIWFDICGAGSALASLRSAAREAKLQKAFRCHGHCRPPELRQMLGQSHVVVVPTRTEFAEGFNQVIAEAILAGRPVVTSSVCPALAYVRGAAVEVPPNDVVAYSDAIVKLRDNRKFYNSKRRACSSLQSQFYDEGRSWQAALRRILTALVENREPEAVSWLPAPRSAGTPDRSPREQYRRSGRVDPGRNVVCFRVHNRKGEASRRGGNESSQADL